MANFTQQQLLQADGVVAGSHDKLDPNVRYGHGYNISDLYAGILPANPAPVSPTYQVGMTGRGQPADRLTPQPGGYGTGNGLTPTQIAALGGWAVDPKTGQPAYSKPNTQVASAAPIRPLWTMFGQPQSAVAQVPKTPLEKAMAPGASLDDLLAYAKTLPDKPAVAATNFATASAKPTGLSQLFTPAPPKGATGTSTNGYTYSDGVKTGVAPQYAGLSPSQMYDAINARAGNQSSSGGGGSSTQSMGSSH